MRKKVELQQKPHLEVELPIPTESDVHYKYIKWVKYARECMVYGIGNDGKVGLFWKKPSKHKPQNLNKRVGSVNVYGYRMIVTVKNGTIYEHQLVWLLFNGNLPSKPFSIDHKDRDPQNNNIDNLRIANQKQQQRNKNARKDGKSRYTGVHWNKQHNKWRVHYYYVDENKNTKCVYIGAYKSEQFAALMWNFHVTGTSDFDEDFQNLNPIEPLIDLKLNQL